MTSQPNGWVDGKRRLICLDFDGVIHSYVSGWQGISRANDPPVDGALEFIDTCLQANFCVAIYSSRSRSYAGMRCMADYLAQHSAAHLIHQVSWPAKKPAAWLTIDDRAWRFTGRFPSLLDIDRFRPWNRPPAAE